MRLEIVTIPCRTDNYAYLLRDPDSGAVAVVDAPDAAAIEAALRAAIVDGMGIKPKLAFGPLRVAVSGQRISPPLFESMEILGKHSTLARLRRLRATYEGSPAEG